MSRPTPRITFCIPTFNGERYLEQAIRSVVDFSDDFKKEIELVISDNCSTDGTQPLCESFAHQFPETVRYFRNEKNVGFDRNIELGIQRASGQYVWFIGDDDFLPTGGVKIILEKISKYFEIEPVVFLAPIDYHNIGTGAQQKHGRIQGDLLCENGDDFFQKSVWASSSISSLIVNRQKWLTIPFEQFFNSQWVHLGVLILALRQGKAVILDSPVINVRTHNARWENNFGNQLYVGMRHLELLERLLIEGYSRKTFEVFVNSRYSGNLRSIISLKPSDWRLKYKIFSSMVHFFSNRPGFWLIHVPVLFFAPNLVKLKKLLVFKKIKVLINVC